MIFYFFLALGTNNTTISIQSDTKSIGNFQSSIYTEWIKRSIYFAKYIQWIRRKAIKYKE